MSLAGLACVAVLVVGSGPASAAFPGGNGKILYQDAGQIVAFDPADNSSVVLADGYDGSYSSDGERIAFFRYGDGHCDLWVMDADGANQAQITSSTAGGCDYSSPAWSPDGSELAFVRVAEDGDHWFIGVIAVDGSSERIIATAPVFIGYGVPDWSPNGDKIAFQGEGTLGNEYGDQQDIYTVNPDGTELTNLTALPEDAHRYYGPRWAPDGSQLVFTGYGGVHLINADGTNLHPILVSDQCSGASGPLWSPDGQKVAYTRGGCGPDPSVEFFTMNADGSNRVPVRSGGTIYQYITDWQPSPPGGPVSVPPAPPPGTTLRQVRGFDVAADGTFAMTGILSSDPDRGQPDVYVPGPGGSLPRITYTAASEEGPSIADDHRIVYSPNGNGVILRNADGSGRVELVPRGCMLGPPAIAPDASFVVYSVCSSGTFRVNSDGTNSVQLDPTLSFYNVEVSPDGTQIAGECVDTTNNLFGICTINSDGTNTRLVQSDTAAASWRGASWSPDGTKLASVGLDNATQSTEINVFNSDGSAPELVPTPGSNLKHGPRWLADGRIAYIYDTAGDGSTSEIRFVTPAPPDQDGDGVADDIDSGAGSWNDGSGTTGSITSTDAGVTVSVADAADPAEGIEISVTGPVGSFARFAICGLPSVNLSTGTTAVFTCGSITTRVESGRAEIVLSSDTSVSIIEDGTATIEDQGSGQFAITDVSGPVSLTIEGQTTPVTGDTTFAAWTFVGFNPPVDNGGVLNVVKAGAAVPLKWRLLDATNSPVTNLATASVSAANLPCEAGAPTDTIEQVASAGSQLTNLGDGYYQLNWKTNKAFAGACKTMKLNLGEGITRNALFKFVK